MIETIQLGFDGYKIATVEEKWARQTIEKNEWNAMQTENWITMHHKQADTVCDTPKVYGF